MGMALRRALGCLTRGKGERGGVMGLRKALRKQAREWEAAAEEAGARVGEDGPYDMSSQEDETMGAVYAEAAAAVRRILAEHKPHETDPDGTCTDRSDHAITRGES